MRTIITTSFFLGAFASGALADKSLAEAVSCTGDSIAITISAGDAVSASNADVTAIEIRAVGSTNWHSVSNASTISQGSGNSLNVALASGDAIANIASGCEVKFGASLHANLEPVVDPLRAAP